MPDIARACPRTGTSCPNHRHEASMQIAVIGAGIVGVSCALHLQREGHAVTLLDPRAPGTATSFGNAGGIVTGAVVPNSTPSLWRDLPHMLFSPDSAVRVRWSYLPRIAPWLLRFLLAGREANVQAISRALHPLVSRAYDAHRDADRTVRRRRYRAPGRLAESLPDRRRLRRQRLRSAADAGPWRAFRRSVAGGDRPAGTCTGTRFRARPVPAG